MKPLCVCILVVLATLCACAQSLPVKDGLWESTVYGDDGKPIMVSLSCLTQASFTEMMTKAAQHPGCKISNQVVNGKGMTVDISCGNAKVQTSSHGVLEVIDSEHARGTTTMKMTMNGQTKETVAKSSMHFKSSNCGDVKPGQPKTTMME